MHKSRLFIAPLTIGMLFAIAMLGGVASAAPAGPAQDHAATIAYWTADRIANAIPREVSPQGKPDFVAPKSPAATAVTKAEATVAAVVAAMAVEAAPVVAARPLRVLHGPPAALSKTSRAKCCSPWTKWTTSAPGPW